MSGRPEIIHGFLTRGGQTAVSLAAAALVVWLMPVAEQGYYWAISGLGGLLQVGELALTQVVLQNAAHYAARGDTLTLARFWRSARLVAAVLTPVSTLVVLGLGFALLGAPEGSAEPAWQAPWVLFVILLAGNQALGPGIGYIEGAVSIADSWRFQARLEGASGLVLLAALAVGGGLWSLPVYAGARLALFAAWLAARRAQFPGATTDWFGAREWRREIWPYQWKLALTAVTSFLIYRAFTPIVFAGMGPEAAARFGLSLAVMGSWLAITVAWPSSQIGRIGTLASQAKLAELRNAFRGMLMGSTALAAAGAMLIMMALWAAQRAGLPFAERSAGFGATAMLLAAAVIQHVVLCASVLLRSERRDPLLPYSVAGSLIWTAALWYTAGLGELTYVAFAYLACSALGLFMGLHAFIANVPAWRTYLRAA